LLWVAGIPGLGKGVLAKFLSTNLTSSSAGIVSSCYFEAGGKGREHANEALCTLPHQLWNTQRELIPRKVAEDIFGKGDQVASNVYDLWTPLVETSRNAPDTSIFCIIDGLDECSASSREKLVNDFRKTFYHGNSDRTGSKVLNLTIIVTSRPTYDIEKNLGCFESIRLRADDETGAITKDLQTAISHQVNKIRDRNMLRPESCQKLKRKFSAQSDGSFLLVHLMFQRVEPLALENNDSVAQELEEAPKDLFEFYDKSYNELSSQADLQKRQRLLEIILAARQPLSLAEINIALHIKPTDKGFNDIDITSNAELGIKYLGGILIRVIDSHIHIVRDTAREYLLGRPSSRSEISGHPAVFLRVSHKTMAETCVYFLLFHTWSSLSLLLKGGPYQI
jgi:hypothetical protein